MVAKTAIVGMFLYGHNLNGIVAILDDTRQYFLPELVVRTDFFRILRHADMALVNQQG